MACYDCKPKTVVAQTHCIRCNTPHTGKPGFQPHCGVRCRDQQLLEPVRRDDQCLRDAVTPTERAGWGDVLEEIPQQLSVEEKRIWLDKMDNVLLGSDAFFPFRDSIVRAVMTGTKYVLQPGGSNQDDVMIEACDQYGIVMVFSGVRLFHH